MIYQSFYHYLVYKFQHISGIGLELYYMFNKQKHNVPVEVRDEILRLQMFLHISDENFHDFEYLLHMSNEEYKLTINNAIVLQQLMDRGCKVKL